MVESVTVIGAAVMSQIVNKAGVIEYCGEYYVVWGIRNHLMVHADLRGFTWVDEFGEVVLVVAWDWYVEDHYGLPPMEVLVKAGRYLCKKDLNGIPIARVDAANLLAKALTLCGLGRGEIGNDRLADELQLRLAG